LSHVTDINIKIPLTYTYHVLLADLRLRIGKLDMGK